MTVKDIVYAVATLVGREDVVNYLSGKSEENEEVLSTVDVLTRLTNLVISELACSYVPMVKTEKINTKNGKFFYSDLSCTPLSIKNVYDGYGNKAEYVVTGEFLQTDSGEQLEYTVLPPNYGLDDKIGYDEVEVPVHVLSYGTAAEFSISRGCFDEAVTWHNKYVNALSDLCVPKNRTLKQRSWI